MQPKISIVIPVYNVEKYLAECLDSVINQTMRDIQIICVNDGSTDGSLAILQEYTHRDSRIEIIDKPNSGPTAARYAAYPRIRGKYTLFVDSDDWIAPELCEKTYHKAEESNAPMTMFFSDRGGRPSAQFPWKSLSSGNKNTVEEKKALLFNPGQFQLWHTDFLRIHNIHFPEIPGTVAGEDILPHWKAIILAGHITILPERLYNYRPNPDSVTGDSGKMNFTVIPLFAHIRQFLEKSGVYHLYKDQYHEQKLETFLWMFLKLSGPVQREFRDLVRKNITVEDREYYRNGKAGKDIARFYESKIEGNPIAIMKEHVSKIVKLPEQALRRWVIKPIKKRLKAA